jgi:large subunit ribosomal protein L28
MSMASQCGLLVRRASAPLCFRPAVSASVLPLLPCYFQSLYSPPLIMDQQIRFRSNRSRRGLYDGKDVRSGNTLSFSMKANKRKFKPNVFRKRLYSEILDELVQFHVTCAALRSIDKAGGLDNYLLKSKHVTEGEGLAAKNRILDKVQYTAKRARRAAEEQGKMSVLDATS